MKTRMNTKSTMTIHSKEERHNGHRKINRLAHNVGMHLEITLTNGLYVVHGAEFTQKQ